jgi:DNA adenine methylase Dam
MIKFFRYAGSKSDYLDIILPLINKDNNLIEPFVGSGAVSLNSKNNNVTISDINKRLIDIYIGFAEANYSDYINFHYSENSLVKNDYYSFYKFREYYNSRYDNLTYLERAFYQWDLIQSCINGLARWSKTGFNSAFGSRTYKLFSELEFNTLSNKIKTFNILNNSFFDLLHLDSIKTTWFLDPPYISSGEAGFGKKFDIVLFYDIIKQLKGNVIYTDTINEYNKKLDWNQIKIKETKSTSTKKINRNSVEHYLFYNFEHSHFDILDIL